MAINSKQKGNSHERNVAKLLSQWSGSKFMRTPMSGAIHNFQDKRVVSDIVAPLSLGNWPFSIECKNTENSWEFNTLIEQTAVFWKQWQQCVDDANREGSAPMLVFTKNYRDIFMSITKEIYDKLDIHPESYIVVNNTDYELVIMKFKEFLSLVSVEDLLDNNLQHSYFNYIKILQKILYFFVPWSYNISILH